MSFAAVIRSTTSWLAVILPTLPVESESTNTNKGSYNKVRVILVRPRHPKFDRNLMILRRKRRVETEHSRHLNVGPRCPCVGEVLAPGGVAFQAGTASPLAPCSKPSTGRSTISSGTPRKTRGGFFLLRFLSDSVVLRTHSSWV
jgi:hypothetical protein